MADLSDKMNMEALVGVIMGILFTILISLILLLMKRNKKSEKVFGTYAKSTVFAIKRLSATMDVDQEYSSAAYHSKLLSIGPKAGLIKC